MEPDRVVRATSHDIIYRRSNRDRDVRGWVCVLPSGKGTSPNHCMLRKLSLAKPHLISANVPTAPFILRYYWWWWWRWCGGGGGIL